MRDIGQDSEMTNRQSTTSNHTTPNITPMTQPPHLPLPSSRSIRQVPSESDLIAQMHDNIATEAAKRNAAHLRYVAAQNYLIPDKPDEPEAYNMLGKSTYNQLMSRRSTVCS